MVPDIIICFLMHGNVNIVTKEKKVTFNILYQISYKILKIVIYCHMSGKLYRLCSDDYSNQSFRVWFCDYKTVFCLETI